MSTSEKVSTLQQHELVYTSLHQRSPRCCYSHLSVSVISGLRFIGNNTSCITDEKCHTPVGFNVIFPGMLGFGIDMGLEFPLRQSDLDVIFRLRQLELQRFVVTAEVQIHA